MVEGLIDQGVHSPSDIEGDSGTNPGGFPAIYGGRRRRTGRRKSGRKGKRKTGRKTGKRRKTGRKRR